MKLWTLWLLWAVGVSGAGWAEEKSEFTLEKGLLETIYQSSLKETAVVSPQSFSAYVVTAQISFMNPEKLRLTNQYFDVSHVDSLKGVPSFNLSVGGPLAGGSGLTLSSTGRLGYAFRESVTKVQSSSGSEFVDLVKMHWLTLGGGLELDYQIAGFSYVRPFAGVDAGVQWLYQSGKLDGLEQGFWVPFLQARAGLNLFARPRVSSEWFGGVNVGGAIRRSVASVQQVDSWSFDLGMNLYL